MTELENVIYNETIATLGFDYKHKEIFIGFNSNASIVYVLYHAKKFLFEHKINIASMIDTLGYLTKNKMLLSDLESLVINTFESAGTMVDVYGMDNCLLFMDAQYIAKDCDTVYIFSDLIYELETDFYKYEFDYTLMNFNILDV